MLSDLAVNHFCNFNIIVYSQSFVLRSITIYYGKEVCIVNKHVLLMIVPI